MERYATFVVKHSRWVILAVALVTLGLASEARSVHFDLRRRSQLPQAHPYVQIQNTIADKFGGETTLVIGVVAKSGDIFVPSILRKLQRITKRLEETPGVIANNLLSIASDRVKAIRASKDGFDARPFLRTIPDTAEGLEKLKEEILEDGIYGKLLVSRDGTSTAILVDFDDRLSDSEIYATVINILDSEREEAVQFVLAGSPVVRMEIVKYTRSMIFLFPIAVLIIGIMHYEAFRTMQAMLLPLVTALVSVTWALGVMGLSGVPMDTWSAITPVVILAVAAGHAVQILKRYYEEYARLGDNSIAIVRSLQSIGRVTLIAGAIAAAGFASLVTFGVNSVRVFGLLLASGIVSALVIEMTFIPACRALLPSPRKLELDRERDGPIIRRVLDRLAGQSLDHPYFILLVTAALSLGALVGISRLHVDNSLRAWFPSDSKLLRDDRIINDKLAGTSTLYIYLDGEEDGDLENPDVLHAISDLQRWVETKPYVGASVSLVNYVRQMHLALGTNHDDSDSVGRSDGIPDDRRLIAQYLFLYSLSGPEDLNPILDTTHRNGALRIFVKTDEAKFGEMLFSDINAFVKARFGGLPVHPRIGGGALGVQLALNEVVVREKILNIIQVSAVIFLLSSLVQRSIFGGLLVLLPLAIAVLISLGIMGLSRIWLSIATASFTAMSVGIGADFAIYMIFRVREEMREHANDIDAAVRSAVHTSGRAIFYVSSAVTLGYGVLMLSGFKVWIYLGALTAALIALSAFATLTVLPAALVVLDPKFLHYQAEVSPA